MTIAQQIEKYDASLTNEQRMFNEQFRSFCSRVQSSALFPGQSLEKSDPDVVDHVPADLFGFSRGAMQAVKLANLINEYGVPDPTSEVTKTLPNHWGKLPTGTKYQTYTRYLHPQIRSVGLFSPVKMMGPIDPITAVASFGLLQFDWKWETTVPANGHLIVMHDANPFQMNPPRFEEPITHEGTPTGDFAPTRDLPGDGPVRQSP